MGYLDYLLTTPYAWVTLSGAFVGGALSRMSLPARADTDRARGMKWAAVYISLTLAVVSATLAVFVPDARLIRDLGLAYQFGGSVIVAGMAMRFKLVAGLLVFLILAVLVVVTVSLRQVWTPYQPPQTVATIRVLSRTEEGTTLEFAPGSEHDIPIDDAVIVDLAASEFSVGADTIELSPHFFFVGMRYGVRLTELAASGTESHRFRSIKGPVRALSDLLARYEPAIPGVEISALQTAPAAAVVLRRYEVRFLSPRSMEIVEAR